MITILMQLEGVLADTRSPNLVDNNPMREGFMLWHALKPTAQISLYTQHEENRARYWLQREHIADPLKIYNLSDFENIEALITNARFNGHDLQMLISADPEHIVGAYRSGLPAMLFVHPSYGRPEWRPDYDDTIKPWDEMVHEIVDKRVALAGDRRRNDVE